MTTLTPRNGLASLLAGVFLLGGCASVGPDYTPPNVALPDAFHQQSALAARQVQTPAPALDRWWQGFADPVLTQIIERALAQNLDLAAALARVEQARAVAQAAGARQMPSADIAAQAARQQQSLHSPLGRLASAAPGYARDQSYYETGLGASWELDLFGGLKRGAEAATAEAQAAEADSVGTRISIAAEAADAYFRVRGAQQRLAIAQAQIKADSQLLDLVLLRLRDGLSTAREKAQAEARLAQVKVTVPPLRIELETQLHRLDVLMAAQPGSYAALLLGNAAEQSIPAISAAQGPADLLRRRPDVIAAERRLAASSARIGAATADYYPKVSLSAVLGFASTGGGNLLSAAAFQPQVASGLRWRLFDFGRVDAEVAHAKGENAQALALYRKALLRATEDVENAIVTLTQLEAQRGDLAVQVAAQAKARQAAQDAYHGGVLSLSEVLEEDRQLLTARDQLALVHAENARAAVATFRALGGGW